MTLIRGFFAACLMLLPATSLFAQDSASASDRAFPNRLIFSETPEIGFKWRPGLRFWISGFSGQIDTTKITLPLPVLSIYENFGGVLSIDILWSGLPRITGKDSGSLADNFGYLTLKSRPLDFDVGPGSLKAGGGLKLYWAQFEILDSTRQELEPRNRVLSDQSHAAPDQDRAIRDPAGPP